MPAGAAALTARRQSPRGSDRPSRWNGRRSHGRSHQPGGPGTLPSGARRRNLGNRRCHRWSRRRNRRVSRLPLGTVALTTGIAAAMAGAATVPAGAAALPVRAAAPGMVPAPSTAFRHGIPPTPDSLTYMLASQNEAHDDLSRCRLGDPAQAGGDASQAAHGRATAGSPSELSLEGAEKGSPGGRSLRQRSRGYGRAG